MKGQMQPEKKTIALRFPEQWAAILKLHPIRDANQPAKLEKGLARIVKEYAARSHPGGERERIRSHRQKYELLANAFSAIGSVIEMLDGLNDATKSELSLNLAAMTTGKNLGEEYGHAEAISRLADARNTIKFITRGWRATTLVPPIAPSHRPKSTLLGPTIQFAGLWFQITGKEPVSPRRGPGGTASEPATEFIRQGLRMIYPGIKTKEVRTAIRAYLSVPNSWNETVRQIAEKSGSVPSGRRLIFAAMEKRAKANKSKTTPSKKDT